jgi:hypothetical protein
MLGGSTSTRLWVRQTPSRPAISSTSATRRSQQRSGARQQLRLRSWLWFYDSNSTTSSSTTPRRQRRTRKKKLSLPLPRVNYHLLSPRPTLGGSAMNNHLAHQWLWIFFVKALVASWRFLSNTCQFSLQSHEARLTVGKAKILGVRLTKRLSKYLEIQMQHTHRFTSDLSSWSSHKCIRLTKGSYVRATKLHKKYRVFILHTTSSSL